MPESPSAHDGSGAGDGTGDAADSHTGNSTVDGEAFASLDKLVHEPARLALMATLAYVERADATFLQKQTGLTWGNLSSHVSKLEAAGYVAVEKTFVDRKPKTLLQLTPEGHAAFADYRTRMLDALVALDTPEQQPPRMT